MKKEKVIKLFLEQLRKTPIVQIACDKAGVSRNSVYRWRNEDEKFRKAWDEALSEGELLVNDMGESQLITMIKEKNWSAISFWLRHHHPKYADKLLVNAVLKNQDEAFTPEEFELIQKSLNLARFRINNNEQPQQSNSTGTGGDNGQKPEGACGTD